MKLKTAVLAAGLVLVGGPVQAQEADSLRLTLSSALDIAVGGNPAYRRATNAMLLNGTEMRATWLDEILPRATLTLFNTNFTGNLPARTSQDNFGNPIENPSAEWNYFSATRQSLNLSWTVRGRALIQAHRRQTLTNEGREIGEVLALTDLQVTVQRLYMDALEQRELMETEDELVAARQIDLDVAERLFSLALRTRVDVLLAELDVEQQALRRRQQQATYERALLALRTQLGGDEMGPLALAEEDLPLFDPSGLDASALVGSALGVNPSLRQAGTTVRSAALGVAEAKNAWWPSVSMGIQVSRRAQLPRGGSLFDVSFDESLDSNFQLTFSVPMFNNFFQSQLAIDRAAVQLDNDREAEREARLNIEESVRSALLELSNQWESLRLAERSQQIADEALRLARGEYRIGTRTFEELRSSFVSEADIRRQVITSRHSFVDALLSLEEAVGTRVRGGGLPAPALGNGTR